MNYVIHYDICALVLFIATSIIFALKKRVPCKRNKVFGALLCVCALSATFDLLSVVCSTEMIGRVAKYGLHVGYYVAHNLTPFMFLVYILFLVDKFDSLSAKFKVALYAPIAIDLLLILSTPFTRFIIYISQDGSYHRGFLQPLCYAFAIYYLIFGVAYALGSRRVISKQVVSSIAGFIGMTLIAVVVQIINPALLVEGFGSAVCLILVMFTLQNQDDMIDSTTKMLNRTTFTNNCMIKYASGDKFSILLIRIPDFTLLLRTFGAQYSNKLLKSFAEYLNTFVNLGDGYYLEDECFALTFSKDIDRVGKVYREIRDKLSSNWKLGSIDTLISADFLRINCPDDAKTPELLMDYIEHFKQVNLVSYKLLRTKDINIYDRKRKCDVECAIDRALKNKTLKVFYQPIYSNDKKKIVSCEALARIFDDELGAIPPEEFIPVAEQNGKILKIGKLVFEEACRFIKKGSAVKMGIEYVQVNLSMVQCMQSGLVDQFMNIMDQYKVEPSWICLEITEMAVAYTPLIMQENIKRLSELGMRLALDDYGAGYSNMRFLLSLPFKYIKLEKEIVWSSLKDEKAKIAIESTIAMIKKLNMKIVAEGIETREQLNSMLGMNCDFIQGFYFSEPVDEKTFIGVLKKFAEIKDKV